MRDDRAVGEQPAGGLDAATVHTRAVTTTIEAAYRSLGRWIAEQDRVLAGPAEDFLAECATIVDDDNLRLGHQLYAEIAPRWTAVSDHITAAGESSDPDELARASAILTDLADRERHAMRVLTGVRTG
ncbi:DUF4872 domain-containing protein [Micromonospora sp. MA102]|uniref:DUF4872 domain-containing protein n=1 Tax=Micromonospora sp. MA102 TaxID=2952755 RepID=UPI0021C6ABF5|nr:DUF4872 domain-containing protein [Micromonospora sp. MA102]